MRSAWRENNNFVIQKVTQQHNTMLLIWFVSLILALISETNSNIIRENPYLSPRSMNGDISHPVISTELPELWYTKTESCLPMDNTLSCAVNELNDLYIHLKDVRIKHTKYGYKVQIKLSSYDDQIKQGTQSFVVKFSFGRDHACYQFLIPLSTFINTKDILLPPLRIPVLLRRYLEFLFFVHKETDEVISVQAINYSLNNVSEGQWLGGSVYRTTYDFDDEYFYVSLNSTQDLKCLFNYNISVYKSHQNHVCSVNQTAVHRWSDALTLPYHTLNMSRNSLLPCEKYCIHAVFIKSQQCGKLESNYFIDIAFFELPPSDTNVPIHVCKKWNFTIDVKIEKKDVIPEVTLWCQYSRCFNSYNMYLYKFKRPTCDTDYGRLIQKRNNFKGGPNKMKITTVFKNVTTGYYCIVVVPVSNGTRRGYWARDSGVFNVSDTDVDNNTKWNEKDERPEFGTKVIVAISLLLFFTAFALWSCSEYIRRSKAKTNEESLVEKEEMGELLLQIPVDEVYLFHSYDDNSIKNSVSCLKKILEDYAQFNVKTLNDIMDKFWNQPSGTISDILECACTGTGSPCTSKKKFIIIISERVLSKNNGWKSLEGGAFHMVLNFIASDWQKAYCHLFLVAFNESIFVDPRFKTFEPKKIAGANYTMPDQLINLCRKLGSLSSEQMLKEGLLKFLEQRNINNVESRLQRLIL